MKSKTVAVLSILMTTWLIPVGIAAKAPQQYHQTTVAILDIDARNVPGYFAESIRSILEYHLTKSERFSILERQHISRIIKENRINKTRIQKIATLLPADYMVSGSIEKIGNYQVLMRVISRANGKILFAYTEQFKKKADYNTVVNILSRRITNDITRHSQNQVVNMYDDLNIYLGVHAEYQVPLFSYQDITSRGVGILIHTDIEHVPVIYSAEIGFINYSMISDELPEMSAVPLLLGIGYRFTFLHTFYCIPRFFAGINYTFGERAQNDTRKNYTGVEFALKGETLMGIKMAEMTSLEMGLGYMHIFDNNKTIGNFSITFGFKVLLFGR